MNFNGTFAFKSSCVLGNVSSIIPERKSAESLFNGAFHNLLSLIIHRRGTSRAKFCQLRFCSEKISRTSHSFCFVGFRKNDKRRRRWKELFRSKATNGFLFFLNFLFAVLFMESSPATPALASSPRCRSFSSTSPRFNRQ
jgi:hypothetical protein